MNDIYEYSDEVWKDIFGGAKFVFENRVFTDELIKKLLSRQDTNKKYPWKTSNKGVFMIHQNRTGLMRN